MAVRGTVRAVVLRVALGSVLTVAFGYCTLRGAIASGLVDDLSGGLGGLTGVVGFLVISSVADARARARTRDLLPAGLSPQQRDAVVTAAAGGPVPDDPTVRTEARRLAEQRADARGTSLRRNVTVTGGLAVVAVVAGAVWSPWWWGDAALLGLAAGLTLRRQRQLERHLHRLRQGAELPEPPPTGVQRLVDAQPVPVLAGTGRGLLELRLREPWGGSTNAGSSRARVDGTLVAVEWGRNRYVVPAGTVRVTVWAEQLGEYGRATTTALVPEGGATVLHYARPALTLLDGSIGPEPQRSRGARVLAAVGLAFLAVLVAVIVLDP